MPGSRPTGPTPDAAAGIKAAIPDLARLPIVFNRRAFSLAEGVRAGLSTAVIIAASEWLEFPGLIEAALGALFTCLCDAGGPIRRRVPALLSFGVAGALVVAGGGLLRLIAGAVLLAAALACGAWGIHGLILVIRAIP